MAVTTHARSRGNKLVETTLEETLNETKLPRLPKLEKCFNTQSTDAYCSKIWPTVATHRSSFNLDKNGILVRLSRIDGAVRKVLPHLIYPIFSYFAYILTLVCHPGERLMHDTLRHEYFRPNMWTDVQSTVRHCQDFPRMGIKFNHQHQVRHFS